MDIGRTEDLKVVEQGLKSADVTERNLANKALNNIRAEFNDGWTRSARQSLLRETRAGRRGNANDIRDSMVRRRGGRMDKGNTGEVITLAVHWPPGLYQKIYG
jgi:hypothetical protein